MFLSVFEMFKIGIGPSSSHTMGPMTAAARFLDELRDGRRIWPGAGAPQKLRCTLHGSLAWTGKGHATDRAVVLGLAGFTPETLDPDKAEALEQKIAKEKKLHLPAYLSWNLILNATSSSTSRKPARPRQRMVIEAYDAQDRLHLQETFYSIGGGFVLTEEELERQKAAEASGKQAVDEDKGMPYPFATASEMLEMGQKSGKTIAQMKRANEITSLDPQDLTPESGKSGRS